MDTVAAATLTFLVYGLFLCFTWPFVRVHAGFPFFLLVLLALSPWSFALFFLYVGLIHLGWLATTAWYVAAPLEVAVPTPLPPVAPTASVVVVEEEAPAKRSVPV